MSDEIAMMKCDWCGKEFSADARACVEAGIEAVHDPEEDAGEEWRSADHAPALQGHLSASDRERMKSEMGLDDRELDELLRTGKIEGLGAIVCLECQDAGLQAAEPFPDHAD